jgi:hypothetical protein
VATTIKQRVQHINHQQQAEPSSFGPAGSLISARNTQEPSLGFVSRESEAGSQR